VLKQRIGGQTHDVCLVGNNRAVWWLCLYYWMMCTISPIAVWKGVQQLIFMGRWVGLFMIFFFL